MPTAPATSPDPAPRANVGWGAPDGAPRSDPATGRSNPPSATVPPSYYAPPGYYPPYQPYAPPAVEPADRVEPDEPADDGKSDPPYFDLAAATYVPLSMGAQASLELPARLLVQLDVGWMPGLYGSAINGLVQELGAYDREIGDLVDGALDGAVVVRASGGWRPFPDAGFEITGGYTFVSVTGSASPEELAALVGTPYGQALSAAGITDDVSLTSRLHNLHLALGWRWVVLQHLVIRANVGYLQTLGSTAEVTVPGNPDLEAQANPIVDETLDEIYTSYVKLPVLGLGAGYRF
jgi:hypothetical protein